METKVERTLLTFSDNKRYDSNICNVKSKKKVFCIDWKIAKMCFSENNEHFCRGHMKVPWVHAEIKSELEITNLISNYPSNNALGLSDQNM